MLKASLATFERDAIRCNWARTQSNPGNTLHMLGDRERDPNRYSGRGRGASGGARRMLTRETRPLDWATAENNLGNA